MAKTIQTLSPEFIEELIWTVNRVKGLVNGGLRGEELPLSRASDGVVVVTPSDGIAGRDEATLYGEYCYLYKILDTVYGDDEISLEAILDGSGNCLTQKVFNAATSAASGDSYFVSELFRSGHRYVAPSEDQRLKFWRSQHTSTSNTASGNTDVGVYNGIESRYLAAGSAHPDVTVDNSAKTITFKTTGYYRIGCHLSVEVAVGSTSAEAKITMDVGSFRSGTFYSTAEFSAINFPQVTLRSGYSSGSGYTTAFAETHVIVNANDILGVRFARTGDTATSLNIYGNLTLGRLWT